MKNFGRAILHNAVSANYLKMIFKEKLSCMHAKKPKDISFVNNALRLGDKPTMKPIEISF